jgi:membrane-associated phospholipid phosphatase
MIRPTFRLFALLSLTLAAFVGLQLPISAQETSSDRPPFNQPDSPVPQTQPHLDRTIDRDISIYKLPKNILQDQVTVFSFPKKLAKGEHWWPTIGITGVTAGFIASDPYSAPAFRNTTDFHGFNNAMDSINTAAFIAAVPAAFYAVGFVRNDSYAKDTALLAGEAVADGFILSLPFKAITARRVPSSYFGSGPYSDSFFEGSHNPIKSGGFYSVHAMAAMSVATVIARRYRNHKWVPFVAYGVAGAICFSRVTRSDHFPADVFFGGAMGYVIARYAVLPARE